MTTDDSIVQATTIPLVRDNELRLAKMRKKIGQYFRPGTLFASISSTSLIRMRIPRMHGRPPYWL